MIAYFPSAYPDELLYSLLSRFNAMSGYVTYSACAGVLFENPKVRPDAEFVNRYRSEITEVLTRDKSMRDVVLENTMYPYYCRFLPLERRLSALEALIHCDPNYCNEVYMPVSREGVRRYLRYCPMCVSSDRRLYGESYWHRCHQMTGVNVCPKHRCFLVNSGVLLGSLVPPGLVPAELAVSDENPIECHCSIEIKAAEYVSAVFTADMDLESDTSVGRFLHGRLTGTHYVSARGKRRNMDKLISAYLCYYKDYSGNRISSKEQLQKIFNCKRFDIMDVCLTAMFLNIAPQELVCAELPEKSQDEIFDERVLQLHRQGIDYMKISRMTGGGYDTVKAIGEGRYGMYHKTTGTGKKPGVKTPDWNKLDTDLLPLVKQAVTEISKWDEKKPQRITVRGIQRYIGLAGKQIYKLPICFDYIRMHIDARDVYIAKEVVWSYRILNAEGKSINVTNICSKINLRRKDFLSCLSCVDTVTDKITADKIKSLSMIRVTNFSHES